MEMKEISAARYALEHAAAEGASDCRVTFCGSKMDLVNTLDGEVDRTTSCLDSSIQISLFVDGRFGTFSTNKLEEESLGDFVKKAVEAVRMLAPDECRRMPRPERKERGALTGLELGLYDPEYEKITSEDRVRVALGASLGEASGEGWTLVSEEGEYCDSLERTLILDSEGLEARHAETSFEYSVEVTIMTPDGERYSGFWWDASSERSGLDAPACGRRALELAVAQIGSEPAGSGKYTMVVDADCASTLVSPILNALSAYSIQQGCSFLKDSLSKKVFPEGLTILEKGRESGPGARLFDSEGVAVPDSPIIEKGVVKQYFVNTYMSAKTGLEPTSEEAVRPLVERWPSGGPSNREEILSKCGRGILVTDFNGGNFNKTTGDFSYGVEGFLFEDGKIVRPVSEMLATGNILSLWAGLLYAGADPRKALAKQVPTLAFANVDFSG